MPLERWLIVGGGSLAFAAMVLLLSPGKAALALIAASLALTIIRFPLAGLWLFALLATSIPYTTVRLGIRITLSEAMLALTWIGTGWQLFVGRRHWVLGLVERRMLRLMLYSAVPLFVGQVVIVADGNGWVNWLRWLLNLSCLLLVPLLVEQDKDRERLLLSLLAGNLLMLLLSIGKFMQTHDANGFIPVLETLRYAHPEAVKDIFSANYTRMASPWVHPNLTGGALALFIPMAFFYALARTGWRRVLAVGVAALGAAGLLLSISRGAIVSLAVVMIWLVHRRTPLMGRIMGVAVALAVALVLFYPPLQHRLSTIFSPQNASTQVRLNEYRHFPDAMRQFPLGIGFKTDPPPPNTKLVGISNLWLNYIYKLGIPGLLLFVMVVQGWWKECRFGGDYRHLTRETAMRAGIHAGLLAALLTGLFDHYYSFTMVLVGLFWLMMGLDLQLARKARTPHLTTEGKE